MTSYCGSHGKKSVRRTRLFESARATFFAVFILLFVTVALVPVATAQTSGSGSFTVQGSEQWYCPTGAPSLPNSPCTPITYDAGTVTIIVNGWSTNASYYQTCTAGCVALALKNALNVSASPVTATVSGATVTMTAKATGSQSNYAVTSSSQSTDPVDFPSPSFYLSPSSFSLTGGTDILPVAPSGISATPAANALSVAISWVDNANNENNYRVERCTGSGCSTFNPLTTTLPPNTTNYTDSTTSPSTTYRYRVQATNTAGGSPYATTSDVTTPSVPAAPSNFNAVPSADGRSVIVTWTDNATTETGYSGNYCPGGTPAGCNTWQNVGTYAANTTTYTMSGLSPGSTNKFEVHAYNAVGDSTHVGNVDVTQPNYPNVPSITSAISGVDGTTATITWSDVATETAYYLERCTGVSCNSGFSVVGNNLPANTTSFGDSGLTSGTTYGYRIRSCNAVGYSGYSSISYLTPTTQPPTAPTGLTATSAGNGQSVTLNWTDNASNETSYQLQRCTGTGCTPANYQSLSSNTVSKTDSPTTPSTLYGYAVCAVNAGGSSCSSTTYVTTSSGIAAVHYYISDHLGSTSLVVNSNGTVEEEEMYYPYGGERWASGTDPNHYKFNGKERDTETGLDYFGARYYGSNMGRWMSPDAINLTDDRIFNPANTLNKYIYGGNSPLKYTDPDGRDIIIFYTDTGPAGHFWMVAYEQTTGESAVMDFGPDKAQSWLIERALPIDVPGTTDYVAHKETVDQIRQDYTSLTIQTNPEDTQKAIEAIKSFNAGKHDWNVSGPNCTTVCRDVLKKILALNSSSLRPKSLWGDIYKKWSDDALNHSGTAVTVQSTHGMDYGRPRIGINTFELMWMLLNKPKQEEVSHRICWTDEKGNRVCQ